MAAHREIKQRESHRPGGIDTSVLWILKSIDSQAITWAAVLLLGFRYTRRMESASYTTLVAIAAIVCLVFARQRPGFLLKPFRMFFPIAGLVVFAISLVRYLAYSDYGDGDFSCYTTVFHNTLHGRFFYSPIFGQNQLAVHSMAGSVLFLPFYALLGNPGLLLAQALCWAGGLFLMFDAAKDRGAPWILALAVAASPCLIAGPFFGFHADILFLPLCAAAILFYKQNRFGPFLAAVVGLCFVKETFALIPLTFSIVALWERRCRKWIILPGLFAAILSAIFVFVLSPALRSSAHHAFYGTFPSGPLQAIIQLFSKQSLFYIAIVLLSYFPLMASSPRLALFPLAYVVFHAIMPGESFRDFWRHYSVVIGALALYPIVELDKHRLQRIAFPLLFVAIISYPRWMTAFPALLSSSEAGKIDQAFAAIPADQSLVAHGPFLARAAQRLEVANWIYRPLNWRSYDYLLFDLSFRPSWWPERDSLAGVVEGLAGSGAWDVVERRDPLILLRNARAQRGNPK